MDKPDNEKCCENGHKRSSSSSSSSGCSASEEQDLFQLDPTKAAQETTKPPLSPSSSSHKSTSIKGYDPNRIPAEIFNNGNGNGNAKSDWSTASNESLFSIHMGKSEELTAYYQAYANYALVPPRTLESKKGAMPVPVPMPMGEEDTRNSISGHSTDGSIASHQSFAFPILTADGKIGSLKNELVRHQTPSPEKMPPPVPPSDAPKEKSEPVPVENKANAGCFSSCTWLPSCRCWGSSSG